jgi:putative flippase GtrA
MSAKGQHAETDPTRYVAKHAASKSYGAWVFTQEQNDRLAKVLFHLLWISLGTVIAVISIELHWSDITAVAAPAVGPIIQEVWDFIAKLG